jgi:hypothetical protein
LLFAMARNGGRRGLQATMTCRAVFFSRSLPT